MGGTSIVIELAGIGIPVETRVLGQFGFPSVMLSDAGKFAREFTSVVEASLPPARIALADLFKLTQYRNSRLPLAI